MSGGVNLGYEQFHWVMFYKCRWLYSHGALVIKVMMISLSIVLFSVFIPHLTLNDLEVLQLYSHCGALTCTGQEYLLQEFRAGKTRGLLTPGYPVRHCLCSQDHWVRDECPLAFGVWSCSLITCWAEVSSSRLLRNLHRAPFSPYLLT